MKFNADWDSLFETGLGSFDAERGARGRMKTIDRLLGPGFTFTITLLLSISVLFGGLYWFDCLDSAGAGLKASFPDSFRVIELGVSSAAATAISTGYFVGMLAIYRMRKKAKGTGVGIGR